MMRYFGFSTTQHNIGQGPVISIHDMFFMERRCESLGASPAEISFTAANREESIESPVRILK